MTIRMNIAEAKAKLSELVAKAEAGEDVVLARSGRPVAKITSLRRPTSGTRPMGLWAHLGPMIDPNLFLEPDPELIEAAEAADEDYLYLPEK